MSRLAVGLIGAGILLVPFSWVLGGINGVTALGVVVVVMGISVQIWKGASRG